VQPFRGDGVLDRPERREHLFDLSRDQQTTRAREAQPAAALSITEYGVGV